MRASLAMPAAVASTVDHVTAVVLSTAAFQFVLTCFECQ